MRLVDCICIVIAELVHDLGYPVVVLGSECIANEAFELECSALALVVELIIERLGDVEVHVDVGCMWSLHVAAGCVSHIE